MTDVGLSVAVIGSGAAGLITGHTLRQDGFDVTVFTRDSSPGGVWSKERVYPDITINNVHGEFRFSCLPMPPPKRSLATGGRLGGEDLRAYMESFADRFLTGAIRYRTEVENVRRGPGGTRWVLDVTDKENGAKESLMFDRLVLCTGGCSTPLMPEGLSPAAAKAAGFSGPILHSMEFGSRFQEVLDATASRGPNGGPGPIVVVGGGKSAQDIAAFLTNEGRKVTVVFEVTDATVAAPIPLPYFIRRSRLLGIMSPYSSLRTALERFLHTTWLGGKIVKGFWFALRETAFLTLGVGWNSPLRRTHSLFWGIRTNDEGVGRRNGYFDLASRGKIKLAAPTRADQFGDDGRSVVLDDGRRLEADAVVLATGYTSSWKDLFEAGTMQDLGLERHPLDPDEEHIDLWPYTSLADPPPAYPAGQQWSSSVYRGMVPAKNILKRDFAVNGAVFTTNVGYVCELSSHWISSYFLGDPLRLPSSVEEALSATRVNAAWMRKRHPDMLLWANESYSTGIAFWNWPQAMDELMEDMGLRSMRSGGNWLTWPVQVVDLKEIASLGSERANMRRSVTASL